MTTTPPPNKKAKNLGDSIANDLICKYKKTASKRTNERSRDSWAAMSYILKENSDILINTKVWVRTLEENKVLLLVLYHHMRITLAQCTAEGDLYVTALTNHKLFIHTSATLQMDWEKVRQL